MKYLSHIPEDELRGKRVLVRLDLNVPIGEGGTIADTDMDRIVKSLPTLEYLNRAGAKTVAISHLGRDPRETLAPVAAKLAERIALTFVPSIADERARDAVDAMVDGDIVLLENVRSDARDEMNDESFARLLAGYADVYVNDAFAVSHRTHASVVAVAGLLPAYAGFQMEQEIAHLSRAFAPASPSMLILGGAKFETKLPVIHKFIDRVDQVVIGGALVNAIYRARGYEIGKSLVDADADVSGIVNHPHIVIPEYVIVENGQGSATKRASEVGADEKIVDVAPESFDAMRDLFRDAQFILWNGPMGNYENGFMAGSESVARLIASSAAQSVVGGGDSVAVVEQLGLAPQFTFVSTGGGAMLDYLAQGTLPGITALE